MEDVDYFTGASLGRPRNSAELTFFSQYHILLMYHQSVFQKCVEMSANRHQLASWRYKVDALKSIVSGRCFVLLQPDHRLEGRARGAVQHECHTGKTESSKHDVDHPLSLPTLRHTSRLPNKFGSPLSKREKTTQTIGSEPRDLIAWTNKAARE